MEHWGPESAVALEQFQRTHGSRARIGAKTGRVRPPRLAGSVRGPSPPLPLALNSSYAIKWNLACDD
jgi:hypothetical protein